MTDSTTETQTQPDAAPAPAIRPLLNLLPGIPAADVCGPDGCAPTDKS